MTDPPTLPKKHKYWKQEYTYVALEAVAEKSLDVSDDPVHRNTRTAGRSLVLPMPPMPLVTTDEDEFPTHTSQKRGVGKGVGGGDGGDGDGDVEQSEVLRPS